jgi:hypothetical protein
MPRTVIRLAAALAGLSLTPAVAADLYVAPAHPRPAVFYAPPAYAVPAPAAGYAVWGAPWRYARALRTPYFLVDQGPEYSGPNITITRLRFVNTDVRRRYPFVGGYHHRRW